MAKYLCAVAFGIGLAVTSSSPARADFYPGSSYNSQYDPFNGAIYHVVSCTSDPTACAAFNATNAPPPANYLDGFNAAGFADYVFDYDRSVTGPNIDLYVTNVNSNGVIIGEAEGKDDPFYTPFVFQNGTFSCCWIDKYQINGINDNNFVVGRDENGYGFVLEADSAGQGGWWLPQFDPASITLLESLGFPYMWEFLAIDNHNTILVANGNESGPDGYGARYLLVSTTLIPEPGSSSLVAAGLVALLLFRKRRSGTLPTAS